MAALLELSVVIPALSEGPNLEILLPELQDVLNGLGVRYEILVVTYETDELTRAAATAAGVTLVNQRERGYGGALLAGFAAARSDYILTMDADISHPPSFIRDLWARRHDAEVTIASRYVQGGKAHMPVSRYLLSRVLNSFFSKGLSLDVLDFSSGFRLYKASVLRGQKLVARDFDILQEILVQAHADGWQVQEVPFEYRPRRHGSSHARVIQFGIAYLRRFWSLWQLRNSILSADYDYRAHNSRIPLQRYWQRSRYRHITELIEGQGPVLDVGCGSSHIIGALPPGSVAVDILQRKLRFDRRFTNALANASGEKLPFADGAFTCVLCSQVIEHIPMGSPILDELCRVLAPGGRLVLGTPDYANWQWVYIEKLYGMVPGSYADEHIAHYTLEGLTKMFEDRGYVVEDTRYILQGELIMAFRKPLDPAPEPLRTNAQPVPLEA